MEIEALPAVIPVVRQEIDENLLAVAVEIGRLDVRPLDVRPDRNVDVLHSQEVVNLETAAVDGTVSGKHHADIMSIRLDGLWKVAGKFSDGPRFNKRVRLAGYIENANVL